jgi:uridylate kinase
MKEKILIKISGEALGKGTEKFDEASVLSIAEQVKTLLPKYEIGLVVGGGNLFRGRDLLGKLSIEQPTADYIGMLATVQNALVLRDFFEGQGIVTRVMSAMAMAQVCEPYIPMRAKRHMEKGRVVIFAAGLGTPFFSTDTAAIQRSLEISARYFIMAKNGVTGVYSDDPKTNAAATKFDTITASDVLEKHLKVADAAAISLAREHHQEIKVVSMDHIHDFDSIEIGTTILPE